MPYWIAAHFHTPFSPPGHSHLLLISILQPAPRVRCCVMRNRALRLQGGLRRLAATARCESARSFRIIAVSSSRHLRRAASETASHLQLPACGDGGDGSRLYWVSGGRAPAWYNQCCGDCQAPVLPGDEGFVVWLGNQPQGRCPCRPRPGHNSNTTARRRGQGQGRGPSAPTAAAKDMTDEVKMHRLENRVIAVVTLCPLVAGCGT